MVLEIAQVTLLCTGAFRTILQFSGGMFKDSLSPICMKPYGVGDQPIVGFMQCLCLTHSCISLPHLLFSLMIPKILSDLIEPPKGV